jgi:hypothetical protein
LTLAFVLLASNVLLAQYKGNPVKKEKLVSVLRSKQLQTREIVNVIKSNGVDFEVTATVEKELVAAGARPEVIGAARDNFRAAVVAKGGKTTTTKFTGKPLDKDAIVTLLQNGVADAQVRKNIEARGVSFKTNAQINTEIKKAGGSVALVNLITASFVNPNENSASNNNVGSSGNTSDDYQDLVGKAVDQYDNQKNTTGAIATLQEAIKADPNEARAYQLLGYTMLYGQKNFAEAEKYMREAINRGGSAVFRVFHDHDGLFGDTCQGSLYIAKDTVRFESDDNVHTFETTDASIKQVKMNSVFKTFYKAKSGSFKIILKSGENDSVKFSFAPLTDNALESKMIIRLIGKND